MTREEYRTNIQRQRVKEVARNKMLLFLLITFFVIITGIVCRTLFASAHTSSDEADLESKYYKSIVIEDGDTLWSIATEYCDEHYRNIQEYVDELMYTNQLKSSQIFAGQNIIVIYYEK